MDSAPWFIQQCCWEGLLQGPVWDCASPVCASLLSVRQSDDLNAVLNCISVLLVGFVSVENQEAGEGDTFRCPLWNYTCHASHPQAAGVSEVDTFNKSAGNCSHAWLKVLSGVRMLRVSASALVSVTL